MKIPCKAHMVFGMAAIYLQALVAPASNAAVVLQGAGASYVSWEAEIESKIINGTPAFWVSTNDATASGGKALYIDGTVDNASAPHSFVQYQLQFATPGTYNLYYRFKADPTRTVTDQFTGNSTLIPNTFGVFSTAGVAGAGDFHTAASNGGQAPGNNVYDWQREADTATYTVTADDVVAGKPLILTIGTREPGFTVDKWVLSQDASLTDATLDALLNSDTSVVTQGNNDDFVAFEAETKGTLINAAAVFWFSTNDATASGNAALYIGGTVDNASAPHSFVQYQLKFAKAGTYNLYYRFRADPARTVTDQFTGNSTLIPNTFGAFSTPGAGGRW